MIILRQKEFSKKKKQNLNFAWEHPEIEKGESYGPYSINGVIKKGSSDNPKYLRDFDHAISSNKERGRIHKSGKYLLYPVLRYKDYDDIDKKYGKRPRVFGSTLKTSYKDSYRGFLKNEESLNNYRGNNPKRFYDDGSPGPTNEDIKNEIRKLAKKEAIKKWGSIGLAGVATIGTGAYLLHKHNKKNKKKQEEAKKRIIGEKTDKAVKGTEAEEKVNKILDKSGKEMREVNFSKTSREVVPGDIVKKVKDGGGVIQKDHNGDWRIISMKTKTNKSGKPEFWPQKGSTKAEMKKILQAYQSNRH